MNFLKRGLCASANGAPVQRVQFSWWIFAPNFGPQNLTDQAPAAARARFIKNSFFAIRIDFSSILVPTCFHFRSENPPN